MDENWKKTKIRKKMDEDEVFLEKRKIESMEGIPPRPMISFYRQRSLTSNRGNQLQLVAEQARSSDAEREEIILPTWGCPREREEEKQKRKSYLYIHTSFSSLKCWLSPSIFFSQFFLITVITFLRLTTLGPTNSHRHALCVALHLHHCTLCVFYCTVVPCTCTCTARTRTCTTLPHRMAHGGAIALR